MPPMNISTARLFKAIGRGDIPSDVELVIRVLHNRAKGTSLQSGGSATPSFLLNEGCFDFGIVEICANFVGRCARAHGANDTIDRQ